jgi:electron transfer flavoprotein beta subunit
MNLIVCIKQVPGTTDVRSDPSTGSLLRQAAPAILNPGDRHALEAALRIREKAGGTVTAMTLGPPQAEDVLLEAYGMGVDRAVLLCDAAFAGSDTFATAYALALAIRKVGVPDAIVCGYRSQDGETGHVGPQLAEILALPQATGVCHLQLESGSVVLDQTLDREQRRLEIPLPCLLSVAPQANRPRYPNVGRILHSERDAYLTVWTAADVGADVSRCGLRGSPTRVVGEFEAVAAKGHVEMIEGATPLEQVRGLLDRLADRGLVGG